MRYLPLIIAFLLAIPFSNAQELLSTASRTARAQIDLAGGQLSKVTDEGEPSHLQKLGLSLSYGELVISYELGEPGAKGYFEMKGFQVMLDGKALDLKPEQIIGESGRINTGGNKRILVAQLLDQYINLKGSLTVTLVVASYGERKLPFGIDCNTPPTFTAKQRSPYFIAAGAGVACIGLGQYFRVKSEDVYENQYKLALTAAEAAPLYEDANGKHHIYQILTYGGSAILIADAVLYYLRDRNYRKQTAVYKEYCGGTSMRLEPVFEIPSLQNPDGQAGLKWTLNF
jgi:hypothetical protein